MGTDFLYARSRFHSGMGTAIDLGGTMVRQYNDSPTSSMADCRALHSDWAMTGIDITNAVHCLGMESDGRSERRPF
jgi:hypothetical protein